MDHANQQQKEKGPLVVPSENSRKPSSIHCFDSVTSGGLAHLTGDFDPKTIHSSLRVWKRGSVLYVDIGNPHLTAGRGKPQGICVKRSSQQRRHA